MKLLPALLSLLVVLVLTSLLSYGMAPNYDSFQWAAFNPMEAIASLMFCLSFGLGFPLWLAGITITAFFLLIWWGFYLVLLRLFFRKS